MFYNDEAKKDEPVGAGFYSSTNLDSESADPDQDLDQSQRSDPDQIVAPAQITPADQPPLPEVNYHYENLVPRLVESDQSDENLRWLFYSQPPPPPPLPQKDACDQMSDSDNLEIADDVESDWSDAPASPPKPAEKPANDPDEKPPHGENKAAGAEWAWDAEGFQAEEAVPVPDADNSHQP